LTLVMPVGRIVFYMFQSGDPGDVFASLIGLAVSAMVSLVFSGFGAFLGVLLGVAAGAVCGIAMSRADG
ncbi:MAG: hypothetical protein ABMB14_37640, partial [Myxococcota bacterium]